MDDQNGLASSGRRRRRVRCLRVGRDVGVELLLEPRDTPVGVSQSLLVGLLVQLVGDRGHVVGEVGGVHLVPQLGVELGDVVVKLLVECLTLEVDLRVQLGHVGFERLHSLREVGVRRRRLGREAGVNRRRAVLAAAVAVGRENRDQHHGEQCHSAATVLPPLAIVRVAAGGLGGEGRLGRRADVGRRLDPVDAVGDVRRILPVDAVSVGHLDDRHTLEPTILEQTNLLGGDVHALGQLPLDALVHHLLGHRSILRFFRNVFSCLDQIDLHKSLFFRSDHY